MTAESIDNPGPLVPDYVSGFPQPISHEQIGYCETVYANLQAWLPENLQPTLITSTERELFTLGVQQAIHDRELTGLPHPMVVQEIETYYRAYPVADADRVHEIRKIAHQNKYIAWARSNPHRCPEATMAWGLARAYRARSLPHATASMYALLSAYGTTLQLLGSGRKVQRPNY